MVQIMRQFWGDERGFVLSTEAILIGTILLIGSIVGLVTLRDQVVQELGDVGAALGNLNHSYHFEEFRTDRHGHCFVAGSSFRDKSDFCEKGDQDGSRNGDTAGESPGCIDVRGKRRR